MPLSRVPSESGKIVNEKQYESPEEVLRRFYKELIQTLMLEIHKIVKSSLTSKICTSGNNRWFIRYYL